MHQSQVSTIKRSQKERLLLKEISTLIMRTSIDDPRLAAISVTRIQLSADKSTCRVFCYTPKGEEAFKEILEVLKLYKPSLRTALAKTIVNRRTPEIVFVFDTQQEKIERLHQLIDEAKEKDEPS